MRFNRSIVASIFHCQDAPIRRPTTTSRASRAAGSPSPEASAIMRPTTSGVSRIVLEHVAAHLLGRLRTGVELETLDGRERIGQEAPLDFARAVENSGPADLESSLLDRKPRHLEQKRRSLSGSLLQSKEREPLAPRAQEPGREGEGRAREGDAARSERAVLGRLKALEGTGEGLISPRDGRST